MLINGTPAKPFNSATPYNPPKGDIERLDAIKELSYLKYGRDREEIEEEIMARFNSQP